MPDFTSPAPFPNKEVGARSQITGQTIRTDETTNTVSVRLPTGLRTGETVAETFRADVTIVLEHATVGGTDWTYTWSNQLFAGAQTTPVNVMAAQAVTGDINDYRGAVVSLLER